ncbi:MAG: FAD binding domain-containing protein [Sphaerochaetaceae bacterium]|nr:FAD binding domain-containing protein [Sphaerochaetaceae bacterium]
MFEQLRSPLVFRPKTIADINPARLDLDNCILFAGGTYLMSQSSYPSQEVKDFINLGSIAELGRMNRVDQVAEAGAMVTIQRFMDENRLTMRESLYEIFSSIATETVRNQATLGGSICVKDSILSMPCILSCLDTQVEIRTLSRRPVNKWMSIGSLYSVNGKLLLNDRSVVLRMKINLEPFTHYYFNSTASPFVDKENAVLMGLFCSAAGTSDKPSRIRLVLAYPKGGLHRSREIENDIMSMGFPLSPAKINSMTQALQNEVQAEHKNVNAYQLETTARLFQAALFNLNTKFLS